MKRRSKKKQLEYNLKIIKRYLKDCCKAAIFSTANIPYTAVNISVTEDYIARYPHLKKLFEELDMLNHSKIRREVNKLIVTYVDKVMKKLMLSILLKI